jgi:hypothetical protein
LEQSRVSWQAWWQRLKMHTRGLLQSLLSEHPEASPSGDFDELQLGTDAAMTAEMERDASTHANGRRLAIRAPPKRPAARRA